MRFAYQAYETHTFVGRIRRSRDPAKLCLMRFAYQAYEAHTFVDTVIACKPFQVPRLRIAGTTSHSA
ncbi:hypothetical protein OGX83_01115, partial [Citrobacter sp. Cpo074]|uniref:hypothetical protein n=1 Tax=Citrobacter sp. Cpo074 TaxID=2985135 RepID=UPI002574E801